MKRVDTEDFLNWVQDNRDELLERIEKEYPFLKG
mgnify:CR=1 FL=1